MLQSIAILLVLWMLITSIVVLCYSKTTRFNSVISRRLLNMMPGIILIGALLAGYYFTMLGTKNTTYGCIYLVAYALSLLTVILANDATTKWERTAGVEKPSRNRYWPKVLGYATVLICLAFVVFWPSTAWRLPDELRANTQFWLIDKWTAGRYETQISGGYETHISADYSIPGAYDITKWRNLEYYKDNGGSLCVRDGGVLIIECALTMSDFQKWSHTINMASMEKHLNYSTTEMQTLCREFSTLPLNIVRKSWPIAYVYKHCDKGTTEMYVVYDPEKERLFFYKLSRGAFLF